LSQYEQKRRQKVYVYESKEIKKEDKEKRKGKRRVIVKCATPKIVLPQVAAWFACSVA
jgi:hypothetical protein